ncbi:MAG: PKD domain-containing protein [Thermoplasmata archaeon]|nr:PKD domain-containing protein [Thermoplasmata archaeon]
MTHLERPRGRFGRQVIILALLVSLTASPQLALVGSSGFEPTHAAGLGTSAGHSASIVPRAGPALTLFPSNGSVGSTVAASGTGFPANTTITFTFAGIAVGSTCSTDATGSFPGTSGTPCTLTVPATPAGTTSVVASGSTGIPVGAAPARLAYDPATSQIFVANTQDDSVSVISDSTDAVVATIGVGNSPFGVAYDSGLGEMFVSNTGSDNVSVISDTTDMVVGTVSVGCGPSGLTYDAALAEIFVADDCSHDVNVISDTNNSVVAVISVTPGSVASDVALCNSTGEIFLADAGLDQVTVISTATNAIVSTVGVGGSPIADGADPGTGDVFVTNQNTNNVSVISCATSSVIASVAVGGSPRAVAYGPGTGRLFVANSGSNDVSVIADGNDSVVSTVGAGSGPDGVAYDTGTNQTFVSNSLSDNLSLIPGVAPPQAAGVFSVDPSVSLLPAQGAIGSMITVLGEGFAANSTINLTFAEVPVPSNCSSDLDGSFPGVTSSTCQLAIPGGSAGTVSVEASDGTNQASAVFSILAGFTLSPVDGAVGTTVDARGVDFAASSTVSFTFGGTAVTSTCSTDANGSFPGASGTGCSFTVPAVHGGSETVSASAGTIVANATFTVTGSLNLSPAAGIVGSPVTATGTGFTANSSVTFTVGGVAAVSNCSADATGSFPGTTGTSCTFLVPATPAGAEIVSAFRANSSGGIGVGVGCAPDGAAYDSGLGEVFVANGCTHNVSVISDASGVVVATVGLTAGACAAADAFDSALGEIFVANNCLGSVSVISDATNAVVATVGVGSDPDAIAYDSGTGEVYVANYLTDNVSVISDTTNLVVATVAVGSTPYGIAYDAGTAQIFVANGGSNNLSVISDTNHSIVATLTQAGSPYALTYDSAKGELFATDYNTNLVTVIADTNDSVVATIAVGSNPDAIAYDSDTGEVFVANYNSNNLTVISDATNAVVGDEGVGVSPEAIAYDSGAGEIYVANAVSDNVSVIIAGAHSTAIFQVNSSLGLSSSTGSVDVGQTVTVSGNGYGSSVGITAFTFGPFAISCTGASVGTCTGGSLATDAAGSFVAQFTVPAVATSGTYVITINDTAGDTSNASVTVFPAPAVSVPMAAPATVDLGQSTTFSAVASLGSGAYSYTWSGLPRGCTGSMATIQCLPEDSGNFSVSVKATDSNGQSATSTSLLFSVTPDPQVGMPSGTPGSGQVDAGGSVSFSASASSGSGTFTQFSWLGLPTGCTGTGSVVTCSGNDLLAGAYSINTSVTDSDGFTSVPSPTLLFFVDQDPTVTSPTASRISGDAGQTVTFSATATLGSGSYSFSWLGLPDGCTGSSVDSLTCVLAGRGSYSIQLEAMDSNDASVTSGALTFVVYSDPVATLTLNRTMLDAGEPVSLAAAATLGSGGFAFVWSGLPSACSGTAAWINCTPSEPGSYSVRVKVTDSNGESDSSGATGLTVASPLVANIIASSPTVVVGQSVEFTANISDGIGPFSITWKFGDGGTAEGEIANHTFAAAGTYTVSVRATDSVGGSVTQSLNLTVSSSSSTSGSLGASAPWELLAAAGILLALVALAALVLVRRRRNGTPPPGESEVTPVPDESQDGSADLPPDSSEVSEIESS